MGNIFKKKQNEKEQKEEFEKIFNRVGHFVENESLFSHNNDGNKNPKAFCIVIPFNHIKAIEEEKPNSLTSNFAITGMIFTKKEFLKFSDRYKQKLFLDKL